MFIHMVLFKIQKRRVPVYLKDCLLWAKEAKRHPWFLDYRTLFRVNPAPARKGGVNEKGQYASFYVWKNKANHDRFMKKHHDRLVSLSKCPVKVVGYYNFNTHPLISIR